MPRSKRNRRRSRAGPRKMTVRPDLGVIKLNTSMSSRLRLRFQATATFTDQNILLSNLGDMIFILSNNTVNTAQSRLFDSIRINSVKVCAAPVGNLATVTGTGCTFTWAPGTTSGTGTFPIGAKPSAYSITNMGTGLPATATFRPPKKSFQSNWLDVSTAGYNGSDYTLFTIGMSEYSTIEIDLSVVIAPTHAGENQPPTKYILNSASYVQGNLYCAGLISGANFANLTPYNWQQVRLN